MHVPELHARPSQQSKLVAHGEPERWQAQRPLTHSVRPQQSSLSAHMLPADTQHSRSAVPNSGARQTRPWQHCIMAGLQAASSRSHIEASRQAPAMHTSESQQSPSLRQSVSVLPHWHSPSTQSIAPQQSFWFSQDVPPWAQHWVAVVALVPIEVRRCAHERPSQHSPLALQSVASSLHISPSGLHWKLLQVSPSQHSELSTQNVFSEPHEH